MLWMGIRLPREYICNNKVNLIVECSWWVKILLARNAKERARALTRPNVFLFETVPLCRTLLCKTHPQAKASTFPDTAGMTGWGRPVRKTHPSRIVWEFEDLIIYAWRNPMAHFRDNVGIPLHQSNWIWTYLFTKVVEFEQSGASFDLRLHHCGWSDLQRKMTQ